MFADFGPGRRVAAAGAEICWEVYGNASSDYPCQSTGLIPPTAEKGRKRPCPFGLSFGICGQTQAITRCRFATNESL